MQWLAIGGAFDLGEAGHDRYVANQLDLEFGGIEPGDDELAVAHVVELLCLGEDFAGGGDAEIVVGEELVHGRNVVSQCCCAPLILELDDLLALHVLSVAMRRMRHLREDGYRRRNEERGEQKSRNAHRESAQPETEHECTGY